MYLSLTAVLIVQSEWNEIKWNERARATREKTANWKKKERKNGCAPPSSPENVSVRHFPTFMSKPIHLLRNGGWAVLKPTFSTRPHNKKGRMEEKSVEKSPPAPSDFVSSRQFCDFLFFSCCPLANHFIRNASKQKSFPFSHCATIYSTVPTIERRTQFTATTTQKKKWQRNEINEMTFIATALQYFIRISFSLFFSLRFSPSALAMPIFTIIIIIIFLAKSSTSRIRAEQVACSTIFYRLQSIDTRVRMVRTGSSAATRTNEQN